MTVPTHDNGRSDLDAAGGEQLKRPAQHTEAFIDFGDGDVD